MRLFGIRTRRSVAVGVSAALGAAGAACVCVGIWLWGGGVAVPGWPTLHAGLLITGLVACALAAPVPYRLVVKHTEAGGGGGRGPRPARAWHAMRLGQLLAEAHAAPAPTKTGLSSAAAAERRAVQGPNALELSKPVTVTAVLMRELHEPTLVLLQGVAVLYALIGDVHEALLALGINVAMILAEVATEHRAKRALQSLRGAAPSVARVLRDGTSQPVPRSDVVTGDTLVLRAGFEVAADARLLSATQLEADESRLTGESLPVHKEAAAAAAPTAAAAAAGGVLPTDTPLAERVNMVYAGSVVTRGRGKAVVVATGRDTELGRVLAAATGGGKVREPPTDTQALIHRLSLALAGVALVVSVLGAALGLLQHAPWQEVVLTALSLAFATIPEELPILVAASLAVGASNLSSADVYVKKLRAMESLAGAWKGGRGAGCVAVIGGGWMDGCARSPSALILTLLPPRRDVIAAHASSSSLCRRRVGDLVGQDGHADAQQAAAGAGAGGAGRGRGRRGAGRVTAPDGGCRRVDTCVAAAPVVVVGRRDASRPRVRRARSEPGRRRRGVAGS
jgi:hypothetical protein